MIPARRFLLSLAVVFSIALVTGCARTNGFDPADPSSVHVAENDDDVHALTCREGERIVGNRCEPIGNKATQPEPEEPEEEDDGVNVGGIVGGVLGGLAGVAIIAGLIYLGSRDDEPPEEVPPPEKPDGSIDEAPLRWEF